MKKLAIFFMSLILVISTGVSAEEAAKTEKVNYYQQQFELYQKGDYSASLALADQAVEQNPESAKPYYIKALCLEKLGQLSEAIAAYQAATAIAPDDVKILTNLAWASYRNNQFTDSEKYSRQAVEKNPQFARSHRILGLAYFELGKTDLAEEEFKTAIELNPDSPYVYNNLGLIYLNNSDFDAARVEFEKAVSFESPKAYMYNNLGISYEQIDKLNEAAEAYQKALEINAGYHKAKSNLERVQKALEKR